MKEKSEHLDILKNRHNASGYYKLLGMCVDEIEDGYARVSLHANETHHSLYETAHGGVTASLADTAAGVAVGTLADDGDRSTTVEMKLNYLYPVRNEKIFAEARVVNSGKKILLVEVEVKNASENLVAKGLATYAITRMSK
ncbi:MAG: PaaI family thioesterase [Chloroflexota bacterium]|nr:PaaI family thioesterase [Chloroflexota bacterium]